MDKIRAVVILSPLLILFFWIFTIVITMVKARQWYKMPLLLFMAVSLFSVFASSVFLEGFYTTFRILYVPAVFFSLSLFPLFYLYIYHLTSETPTQAKQWIKHLAIPFMHCLLALIVMYFYLDKDERIFWVEVVLTENVIPEGKYSVALLMDGYFRKVFLLLTAVYFIITDIRIRRHSVSLKDYFSNTEDAEISWFPFFRFSFLISLIAAFVHFAVSRSKTLEYSYVPVISHSLLALFFWITGYFGNMQKRIYPTLTDEMGMDEPQSSPLPAELEESLNSRLNALMYKEKVFVRQNLSLPGLAKMLGTNRSYLSRFFNENLNTNFNRYINEKRVEYVIQIMTTREDAEIHELWALSGFNSVSSFYRWFSHVTGMSPNAFKKNLQDGFFPIQQEKHE